MNLRAIDLNLLTVLDALLDEAHVSRAADRIGLSQPAASSALERCRHLFKDRLLERSPGGMRLTLKAQALREPLKQALLGVRLLIEQPVADLVQLSQTVRLLVADQPAAALVSPVVRRLSETAPGLKLVILPWLGANDALNRLARGEIDLAASVFPVLDPAFRRRFLLDERYVVAMRQGHPASGGFDLDRWLAYPHVLVSSQGSTHGALDEALQALGSTRRVGLVVPSFLMVPPLLLDSNLIAMLPTRCLPTDDAERKRFAVFEPPIAIEGFTLHLAWHERRDEDVAVRHVVNLVEEVFVPRTI